MLQDLGDSQVTPSNPTFVSGQSTIELDAENRRFALVSDRGRLVLGLPQESSRITELGGFATAEVGPDASAVPLTKDDGSLQIGLVIESA